MSDALNKLFDEYEFEVVDKGGLVLNECTIDILNARKAIFDYIDKQRQALEETQRVLVKSYEVVMKRKDDRIKELEKEVKIFHKLDDELERVSHDFLEGS